jgi:hypothetical protein
VAGGCLGGRPSTYFMSSLYQHSSDQAISPPTVRGFTGTRFLRQAGGPVDLVLREAGRRGGKPSGAAKWPFLTSGNPTARAEKVN